MLTPELKNYQWKLISPFRLQLLTDPPLANSTSYTLKVPAGTTSTHQDVLQKDFLHSFSTPVIKLIQKWPFSGMQTPLPIIFMEFDQLIDVREILQLTTCRIGSSKKNYAPLTLLPPERATSDFPSIKPFVDSSEEGKWIAFMPSKPFPYDAKVTVTIAAPVCNLFLICTK